MCLSDCRTLVVVTLKATTGNTYSSNILVLIIFPIVWPRSVAVRYLLNKKWNKTCFWTIMPLAAKLEKAIFSTKVTRSSTLMSF